MPSIFDLLLGQAPGSQTSALAPAVPTPTAPVRPPSILDSPDYRSERLGDALRGMSAALVRAGAPSQYPQGFAEAFGQAGMGVGQGMEGSEDKFLKRALVNAQVSKAESEVASEKALKDAIRETMGQAPASSTGGAAPSSPAAPSSYDARVGGLEGGSKNGGMVYNELGSGAGGPYQIMPATWAAIRTAHPELNLPETMPVDNTPQTRALHDAAHGAFKADNTTLLKQAGIEPTPDNLYLAHRFGASGAMAVLRADPNKLLAEVLPISWQAQNPDMRGQTAGGFRRLAGERMQGVGGGTQVAAAPAPSTAPAVVAQGDAVPASSPVQTDGAPPPGATGGPVQLAQATPGQAGPAPAPVAPPVGQTLRGLIQGLKPAEQTLMLAMKGDDIKKFLLERAAPNHEAVLDSVTGQVVFVDKRDPGIGSRYQPVKGAELAVSMRQAAAAEEQARARTANVASEVINRPLTPGVNGGPPTPTPGFVEQKGAVSGAEETAKVQPKLLAYQGELVIKDHGQAQAAAAKARQDNNDLGRLDSLLEGIQTGKGTPLTQEAKAWAKAAGFNLDALGVKDDVGNTQAAQSVLNRMALEMRNTGDGAGMPGSMSDADRNFLTKIPPELSTTPEGRKLIIDYMKWANQRTIDIAEAKNKFVQSDEFAKSPAKMYSEVKKFADSYPSFAEKNPLPTAAPTAPAALTPEAIDAELARRKAAKGAK